jgi:hypothetical protein
MVPDMTINPLTLVTRNNFGLWMILEMINVVVVLFEIWLLTYLEGPKFCLLVTIDHVDGATISTLFFQLAFKQQQHAFKGIYW